MTTTETPTSDDIKRTRLELLKSKAEFFKTTGRAVVVSTGILVAWNDAKTTASTAKDTARTAVVATATERVSSDEGYAKLVSRMNAFEEDFRTYSTKVDVLAGSNCGIVRTKTSTVVRAPKPKLSARRPSPKAEAVRRVREELMQQSTDQKALDF